jgi:hypothetical protein
VSCGYYIILGFDYNSDRILIPGLVDTRFGIELFVFVALHWTQQSNSVERDLKIVGTLYMARN